ncbi:MAG TPA: AAA family ATPase [Desulfosporosinus sp.]|nr:AAA family ATPase [Desulfosporosinus sp.]
MIISFQNQKGGVGKTSSCVNVGYSLSQMGKSVLLVDLDPQANTTVNAGIDDEKLDRTIYNLLTKKGAKAKDYIISTKYGMDLLPANIELADADITLASAINRESILRKILEPIKNNWDYILIDCPPNLGLLSLNALTASQMVIIPVCPGFFSIKGLGRLFEIIGMVRENLLNPDITTKVLVTMYDAREKLYKDIMNGMVENLGQDMIFKTKIRVNTAVKYSQEKQQPTAFYNKKCKAAVDYDQLAREVLE